MVVLPVWEHILTKMKKRMPNVLCLLSDDDDINLYFYSFNQLTNLFKHFTPDYCIRVLVWIESFCSCSIELILMLCTDPWALLGTFNIIPIYHSKKSYDQPPSLLMGYIHTPFNVM